MANRAIQWTGKAILAFSLTIPVIGAQRAPVPAVFRIRVLVCDQAGLPGETLIEAQRLASSVFREAAIELFWLDGGQSSVAEADYVLRIHCCFEKLNTRLHRRTVAFAPAGGRHVTVFWDRIRTEAAAGSHPETLMLGYVIAHELGHLLLPRGYHSPHGIMQDRLNYEDWSQVRRMSNLFFSRKEVSQMRAALIGRSGQVRSDRPDLARR
jgi:hypothetical protein